jgi:hypothetical protein
MFRPKHILSHNNVLESILSHKYGLVQKIIVNFSVIYDMAARDYWKGSSNLISTSVAVLGAIIVLSCKLGQTATDTHDMIETVCKNEAVRYSYSSLRMV